MTDIVPDWPSLTFNRLSWGRDGAQSIGSLQEAMGVSRRIVERAVESLRAGGAPICTGPDGVWLSVDQQELLQQVDALRRRAIHQLLGARALRQTARRYAKVKQLELAL